jgi:hypothetical protein
VLSNAGFIQIPQHRRTIERIRTEVLRNCWTVLGGQVGKDGEWSLKVYRTVLTLFDVTGRDQIGFRLSGVLNPGYPPKWVSGSWGGSVFRGRTGYVAALYVIIVFQVRWDCLFVERGCLE